MDQHSFDQQDIPDVVVRRLPIYARTLTYLLNEGAHSVSSQELGERINVTAAQIRKDLSWFGEFGKQGIGYDVEKLLGHINRILGLTQVWPVVLVGTRQARRGAGAAESDQGADQARYRNRLANQRSVARHQETEGRRDQVVD